MKRTVKTAMIIIATAALTGTMVSCGGSDLEKDAKKLAQITAQQMKIEKELDAFGKQVEEKYGADEATMKEFYLTYIKELKKAKLSDEELEYLDYLESVVSGEQNDMMDMGMGELGDSSMVEISEMELADTIDLPAVNTRETR